jgi:hypothetical protein
MYAEKKRRWENILSIGGNAGIDESRDITPGAVQTRNLNTTIFNLIYRYINVYFFL